MTNYLLCVLTLTELFSLKASESYIENRVKPVYVERLGVCLQIAEKAETQGVDPVHAVALAYQESAFNENVVSSAGAVGAMQVLPWYACPRGRSNCDLCNKKTGVCDWVTAGLRAMLVWKKHFNKLKDTLCHYNAGWKCNKRSRVYARAIMRRIKRLRVQLAVSRDFEP